MKFRVWDKNKKSFLASTNWALDGAGAILTELGGLTELGEICAHDGRPIPFWGKVNNIDNLIIQRATGLQDWTGREIYEGDLIKVKDYGPYPVTFEEGCFGSCIYSDFEPLYSYGVIEVVGNILENPKWNENTD